MSAFPESDRQPPLDTPPLWADSVEKVPNLKSLQICQNANGIFD
jgi:hypothetical protein